MNLRARTLVALGGAALGLTACAAILGIDEGIPDTASGDAGDASVDGGADVVVPPDAPPCTPDASEQPNDAIGVFVAAVVGSDRPDCGTREGPCATIQTAVDRAASVTGKTVIYVAHGDYKESVSLKPGLTIDGAWEIIGQQWLRNCLSTPSDAVHVRAPDDQRAALYAEYDGTAKVRLVSLDSKATAAPGESLYGVFARGATTLLTLEQVTIHVAPGGDGADGKAGAIGDAGVGLCPPSDGGQGAPSTALGGGADGGRFDSNGYFPSAGGSNGGNGALGLAGAAGSTPACAGCFGCTALVCGGASGSSCGTGGPPGCPGAGGFGGAPGNGGGSSVGVFVWDANVTLVGCTVTTGAGGAGGNGGAGGAGGVGSDGDAGAVGPACNVCSGAVCAQGNGPAGGAGGRGGTGGMGARGGGGAGGWSVGVFQGGDAGQVTATDTRVQPSAAGTSRGNGAPGQSAEHVP